MFELTGCFRGQNQSVSFPQINIWTLGIIIPSVVTKEKSPVSRDEFLCLHISSSPHLSAGGAEAVLVCANAMPTEAADLIAAGAGEEVDVINLQRLHTQRALHGVVLHLRAVGHPMARRW